MWRLVIAWRLAAIAASCACAEAACAHGIGMPVSSAFPVAGCANIVAYGGDASGIEDNAAAFDRAAAANPATPCIAFPPGTFRFARPVGVSLRDPSASIAIVGAGAETTKILAADMGWITLTLGKSRQNFHLRDFTVLAPGHSLDNIAIAVVQKAAPIPDPAQSDISNVIIRGADGYNQADQFGTAIALDSVSSVNLFGLDIAGGGGDAPYNRSGTGLRLSASAAQVAVQANLIGCQIDFTQYAVWYGPYYQGVQITASNFTGNQYGVYQAAGQIGNDQLAVSASQFNSGFRDIYLLSAMDDVTITGSMFYLGGSDPAVPGQGAAAIETVGNQFAITGNAFHQFDGIGAGGDAILVTDYRIAAGVITGNTIDHFGIGVRLAPGSQRVNVQSNSYSNTGKPVVNEGRNNIVGGGSASLEPSAVPSWSDRRDRTRAR